MTDKQRVIKFHIVLMDDDDNEYPVESTRICTQGLADQVLLALPHWAYHLGLKIGCATVEDAGPGMICNHADLCTAEPVTDCEHWKAHAPNRDCQRKCEFHDGQQCVEVQNE